MDIPEATRRVDTISLYFLYLLITYGIAAYENNAPTKGADPAMDTYEELNPNGCIIYSNTTRSAFINPKYILYGNNILIKLLFLSNVLIA